VRKTLRLKTCADLWLLLPDYGDVAFRIFGNWARVGVNVLQSFQFFLNVSLIIESSGQSLAQMAAGVNNTGFLCFECERCIGPVTTRS